MSNTFDRNNNDDYDDNDYDDNDYEVDYDPFDDDDYYYLDVTVEWLQAAKNNPSGILAIVTSDINENNPGQQDCHHLQGEIEVLDEIKNVAPHLTEEVSSLKDIVQMRYIDINPHHSDFIVIDNPKLAPKALNGIKEKLDEGAKFSDYDIEATYKTLASIIKTNPELYQDAFGLFIRSMKLNHNKSGEIYNLCNGAIPALKKIKDTMTEANQVSQRSTRENNRFENVCTILRETEEYCVGGASDKETCEIIKDRPDLADKALKKITRSDSYIYGGSRSSLAKTIIKADPNLSKTLIGHLRESYRKGDSFNDCEIFNLLGALSDEGLDVAKDAFEVIRDIEVRRNSENVIGAKYRALSRFVLSPHHELGEQAYEILSNKVLTHQNPYTTTPEVDNLINIVINGGEFKERAFTDYKKGIRRLYDKAPAWEGMECIALHAEQPIAQEALGMLEDMVASDNKDWWINSRKKDIENIKKTRPTLLQNDKNKSNNPLIDKLKKRHTR